MSNKYPYVRLEHSNPTHSDWFVVNWCLGNTCNYACSYCPPSLHDHSIRWPDPEVIKRFILKVKASHPSKKFYFEFTGGEVTTYRHFIDICKFCAENDVKVGLITNGSRTLRYFEENKKYFDHICISFHPEFADAEHFMNVVKIIHNDVRTHINIMMHPEKFDLCFDMANQIKELGNLSMALQPLIHDFGEVVYDYTDEQKNIMDKQTILITGASSGLGYELALQYSKPHIRLILVGRNLDQLNKIANLCSLRGAETYLLALDIREKKL